MEGLEKLRRDLVVLRAMADAMDEYLRSDVLFYPTVDTDLPQVTVGGYLMRQHRLLELRDLLSMEEQTALYEAINIYNDSLREKVVRFETKANQEIGARLRQWAAYLDEIKRGVNIAYYESAVDTRAMLEALVEQLRVAPYRLEEEVPGRVAMLDRELRRYWQPGEFVWPTSWRPAYPSDEYWWLYGHPRKKEER